MIPCWWPIAVYVIFLFYGIWCPFIAAIIVITEGGPFGEVYVITVRVMTGVVLFMAVLGGVMYGLYLLANLARFVSCGG